jgi:predicted Ser/Thr protein kinase
MIINGVKFYETNPSHGTTSKYFMDKNSKYFLKIPQLYKEYNILEREVRILKILKDFEWCPNLVYSDLNSIITEYSGDSLNKNNIPNNYEEQIFKILNDLKKLGIKHNDIWAIGKNPELLVKDNKIYLIDFGWCSIYDDFSCGDEKISKKKKPYGVTDDNLVIDYIKKYIIK